MGQPAQGGRSRAIVNSIQADYMKKYRGSLKDNNIVITQSYLRLESAALTTQSSIGFGVLVNEMAPGASSVSATEKRLALTDDFICTSVGVYLAKIASGGTIGNTTLNTFPNSLVYTGSSEALYLQNIYNGSLACRVNGTQILTALDVLRHYRVGNAQKSVLTAASGTGNAWDASTWDTPDYGMFPLTPQIALQGNSKNDLSINLPLAANLAGTSSTNVCVLIFRGLLVQNGSRIAQS